MRSRARADQIPKGLAMLKSPYFRKCLSDSKWKESQTGIIAMHGYSPRACRILAFFIYKDDLPQRSGLNGAGRNVLQEDLEAWILFDQCLMAKAQNLVMVRMCSNVRYKSFQTLFESDIEFVREKVGLQHPVLGRFIVEALLINLAKVGSLRMEQDFPDYVANSAFLLECLQHRAHLDRTDSGMSLIEGMLELDPGERYKHELMVPGNRDDEKIA